MKKTLNFDGVSGVLVGRPFRLLILLAVICIPLASGVAAAEDEYTTDFYIEACSFSSTGSNLFFSLRPGSQWYYEGEEDGAEIAKLVTVLPATHWVQFETVSGASMNVRTRVLKEEEWEDEELVEISHNYVAICRETGDAFYFGEEVDIYEDGEVVAHDGAWEAGVDGAVPGIIMPARPLAGSRYYQEIAPGVALDRAEHTEVDLAVEVEAGEFERCFAVEEDTPLEPGATSDKIYCPSIGMVIDDELELVSYSPHFGPSM